MKHLSLIFAFILSFCLVACSGGGGSGGSGGDGSNNPGAPSTYTFKIRISGSGNAYDLQFWINSGDSDQREVVSHYTVTNPFVDVYDGGRNVFGHLWNNGGTNITVDLYQDDIIVQTITVVPGGVGTFRAEI